MKMEAYLVNDYHVFINYEELSSHVHDVVNHTAFDQKGNYLFSIIKGKVHCGELIFITQYGEEIPLQYEQEDDYYYSTKIGV